MLVARRSAGYGYPALIAFNPSKSKYASLRSAFEEKHVQQFLDSVRLVSLRLGTRRLHPANQHAQGLRAPPPAAAGPPASAPLQGCQWGPDACSALLPHRRFYCARCPVACTPPPPPPCNAASLQGFERVADVSGELARVQTREPWDGGEGAEEAADEFDLADLMAEEVEGEL